MFWPQKISLNTKTPFKKYKLLAGIVEIDISKCNVKSLSAGILLIDILSKFHPTVKKCFVSCKQFQEDLESSGDDMLEVWRKQELDDGKVFFQQCGLFDVAFDLGQALRDCLPRLSPEQLFTKGKKYFWIIIRFLTAKIVRVVLWTQFCVYGWRKKTQGNCW